MSETYKFEDIVEVLKEEAKDKGFFVAKITGALYKWPKGEASYSYSYGKPLPQIIVQIQDGTTQRYCGQEAVDTCIKRTTKVFREKTTLKQFLDLIIIDKTQAYRELGDGDDSSGARKTLFECCEQILPFIQPLLGEEVYISGDEEYSLGEFDRERIDFASIKVGRAMRNSGSKGFILTIFIDGYAPTTFSLTISEVYFWN